MVGTDESTELWRPPTSITSNGSKAIGIRTKVIAPRHLDSQLPTGCQADWLAWLAGKANYFEMKNKNFSDYFARATANIL